MYSIDFDNIEDAMDQIYMCNKQLKNEVWAGASAILNIFDTWDIEEEEEENEE